ncbi:30S ribosomal protein S2 [Candidatus Saccharibacteria bacterium]|jgi:small subunit ribosomal protein S2|nr:30S ribosomal protein S2 [Candidatus Saccharibacteria bacterium]HOR23632.1 30S ribosomal protein S2 [Candidatus Saccharibacteria bacterium]
MSEVDIKALLEAGAHFGHKTSTWHPKMAPYLHSKKGKTLIINLETTVRQIADAMEFVEKTIKSGRQVLFVGTKRQAKDAIKRVAESVSQPYVNERWLGGILTNSNTVNARIKKLKDYEAKMSSGELAAKYSKLEVQRYQEQIDEMNYKFGGIKEMHGRPGALFIADILEDEIALKEANKLGIPIIGLTDTNADPTLVTYPIACNDDAIKTINLVLEYIKQAVLKGQTDKEKNQVTKGE